MSFAKATDHHGMPLRSLGEVWLPTSAVSTISIFDKTLLTQVKNQLELVEDIETSSYKAPDFNKEVVEYGSKRTIQA